MVVGDCIVGVPVGVLDGYTEGRTVGVDEGCADGSLVCHLKAPVVSSLVGLPDCCLVRSVVVCQTVDSRMPSKTSDPKPRFNVFHSAQMTVLEMFQRFASQTCVGKLHQDKIYSTESRRNFERRQRSRSHV